MPLLSSLAWLINTSQRSVVLVIIASPVALNRQHLINFRSQSKKSKEIPAGDEDGPGCIAAQMTESILRFQHD